MSLEYQPLNTYLNEIRLLSLQPSKNIDGPIACSLSTISLDDKPLFEALSYVWGGATATADIFVDGVAFSATTNLHDALKHIRPRTGDPRIMWIDAICINQNDDSERNHQVPLMQRIYSGAAAAVVWLGPSNYYAWGTLGEAIVTGARFYIWQGELVAVPCKRNAWL
ncbi:Heterokaryon incompatibility protein 6, OR allele [Cytospora mali]|uniref:Heterokaryon incompatibility protein 6, OR allele n=1 Tax=Cytospora mali TaxID=578113 RepID=A0A194VX07_CYTMA|nr:Heterokaryon incompatibility protein 6, OR allele [Valsa mali]